jgi:hypothetical protein
MSKHTRLRTLTIKQSGQQQPPSHVPLHPLQRQSAMHHTTNNTQKMMWSQAASDKSKNGCDSYELGSQYLIPQYVNPFSSTRG